MRKGFEVDGLGVECCGLSYCNEGGCDGAPGEDGGNCDFLSALSLLLVVLTDTDASIPLCAQNQSLCRGERRFLFTQHFFCADYIMPISTFHASVSKSTQRLESGSTLQSGATLKSALVICK